MQGDQEMPDQESVTTRAPSEETVASWRLLMTVLARSMNVKLGLVTRCTDDGGIEMTAPSLDQGYYDPGERLSLEPGLLCEYVITRQAELVVADSRSEAEWVENPDARLGLLAYLGFPVYWPDGAVFGTICVLNDEPRDFSQADRRLLLSARDAIHDSLGVASATAGWQGVGQGVDQGVDQGADRAAEQAAEHGGAVWEAIGSWDYDPAHDRLRLSPSILRQYGLADARSWSIDQWLCGFPEDQRSPLGEGIAAIAEGRTQTLSVAVSVPGPDGDVLVRITARGLHDDAHKVVSIVGSHLVLPDSPFSIASVVDPFFSRDPMTGLPTRAELEYRVQRSLERHSGQPPGAQVVMAIVEVTNVGEIVHADGIDAADTVMVGLADRLRGSDRFVAALGFGYFAVLVSARGTGAAERLAVALRAEVGTLPSPASVTPSISITTVDVVEIASGSPDQFLAEVTRGPRAADASPPDVGRLAIALTERQKEIASLVAQGLSNREIADALVITVRTVEGHLDGIRDKLGLTSRTQLVGLVLTRPEVVARLSHGVAAGRSGRRSRPR